MKQSIEQWDVFELTLHSQSQGNPFLEINLSATFVSDKKTITVSGFYDGNDIYKIRFMPDMQGLWQYTTISNCSDLNGICGEFNCTAPSPNNHGPVNVHNTFHFSYADHTPYYPFGTTCYVWTHQGEELESQTIRSLKKSPFNKIRMCVFPKHYIFNNNEPSYYPFEGSLKDGWDFTRFNPSFFQHLERRVQQLNELGIEADLILFHPYDEGHWGFDSMGMEVNIRYLKYLIARLSAYRNIWWSMANEYDLLKSLKLADWDTLLSTVALSDPYNHLRSIHNCNEFYDHSNPLLTHASIQRWDLKLVSEWRKQYQKPIVVDECCYEGNIPYIWGELTEQEMSNRIWEGVVRGGYVGHGETYLDPNDILWWAKGGILHGKSPERISFLRKLIEKIPKEYHEPVVFEPAWENTACIGKAGEFYLVYFGSFRPALKYLELKEGSQYKIDIIDTWEMTITTLPKLYQAKEPLSLPGKPYIALRIQKAE